MLHLAQDFGTAEWFAPSLSSVLDALGLGPGSEIIATPSSWVVLTDRHAYKLLRHDEAADTAKRSPDSRQKWCAEEIWRNERLAPGVYQGLVSLSRTRDGKLRMGGAGVVVEWIVKMRRLRAEQNLKALLRHREICRSQIAMIARAVTAFYEAGPPQHDQVDELTLRVQHRINEATGTLIENVPKELRTAVRRVRDAQRHYLQKSRATLNVRVCDGRVVVGHGDLLPEHIFLEREPLIIGAVANAAVIPKIDAIDDLSLLAMECEHLGREDLSDEIMTTYRKAAGDERTGELESFYKCVHACRRAADAFVRRTLSPQDPNWRPLQEVRSYLDQASSYAKHFEASS